MSNIKPLTRVKNVLTGDTSRLTGDTSKLWGDCSGLYGDCTRLYGNCTGLYGNCTRLIGNCSNLSGDCSKLYGNCSNLSGNCSHLTGNCSCISSDCTNLRGNCSELFGNCDGLFGDCSKLQGNCSRLIGDCTGLVGNCTKVSGNLDSIPISERAEHPDLALAVNPGQPARSRSGARRAMICAAAGLRRIGRAALSALRIASDRHVLLDADTRAWAALLVGLGLRPIRIVTKVRAPSHPGWRRLITPKLEKPRARPRLAWRGAQLQRRAATRTAPTPQIAMTKRSCHGQLETPF